MLKIERLRKRFSAKYDYDAEKAEHPIWFIESFCSFSAGEFAGKPFKLQEWQKDMLRWLYGWRHKDSGLRVVNRLFLAVPRKQGKSELCAALGIYEAVATKMQSNVVCAAGSRDQAKMVFNSARIMVENNRVLKKHCKPLRNEIACPNNSDFRTISADAGLAHGLRLSCAIADETHTWVTENGEYLYNTLKTSMASRREYLLATITTAGNNPECFTYELWQHARRVETGEVEDDSLLPVIYEASPEDDPFDEKTWAKANPGMGVSVFKEYLADTFNQARLIPRLLGAAKQLHLNIWAAGGDRWISAEGWQRCELDKSKWPDLTGHKAWLGLDLSTKKDLTALVACIPYEGKLYIEPYAFIPQGKIDTNTDGAPYASWRDRGYVDVCPGDTINVERVLSAIYDLTEKYDVQEVCLDTWKADRVIDALAERGISVYEHRQGFLGMSEPCVSLETSILDGNLVHDGNPVMRWCALNACVDTDASENIKPVKRKSTGRIDLLVAAVMAVGRATTAKPVAQPQMGYL